MKNLKDEIKFPCGLSMKNRFMLAPLIILRVMKMEFFQMMSLIG